MSAHKVNSVMSGHLASVAVAIVGLYLLGTSHNLLYSRTAIDAAPKAPVKLTPTLAAWISSQSENIVEEMEAIVKQQVETNQFSVVLYLRYLNLFDTLKVVADRADRVDKFQWIAKKVKAFSRVYRSVYDIVTAYLRGLDDKMTVIELGEKKSRQNQVNSDWVNIYETINYIKMHAPRGSGLAKEAAQALLKSPTGSADKRRSTRYLLHRNAFH